MADTSDRFNGRIDQRTTKGAPMNGNLAANLNATARQRPERTAVKLDRTELSYAELDRAAKRVAGFLKARGVEPGDRVGLMVPNVPEFAMLYYGVLSAGAVVVPMNVQLKRREVAYYMEDSGAKLVFAWHGCAKEVVAAHAAAECVIFGLGELDVIMAYATPQREIVPRAADDTAVVLYTSGTTGRPKGAELTHANLARNAAVARQLFSLDERSVFLGVLPLFHSFGQTCALNATIATGGLLTLVSRFVPEAVLEVIERDKVDVFAGVPTMYSALLHEAEKSRFDVSSLRVCISGGAALPVELLRGFEARFKCMILEGYGLSETSPIASFNHPDRERKAGSIGTPIEGVEMQIVDGDGNTLPAGAVGEIVIRGHNVMKGYWHRPDATAVAISADGWFHSGDIGRVDEDGYFFIVDRMKDMIIRGGYNVYPREIEELLYQHPAVRECAVVGLPHPSLGEEVGAAVVLKTGYAASADELRDFVKEQVAAYKYPRHLWFVDELPKTATGKILKRNIEAPMELLLMK
jgi:long-chain acyl-CoA synthetase